jgi:hypothetical protein
MGKSIVGGKKIILLNLDLEKYQTRYRKFM